MTPAGDEPLLRVRLEKQPARLRKQQQLPVESLDDVVDVGFEHGPQLGEELQVFGVEPEVAEPLLDRLLGHPRLHPPRVRAAVNDARRRPAAE